MKKNKTPLFLRSGLVLIACLGTLTVEAVLSGKANAAPAPLPSEPENVSVAYPEIPMFEFETYVETATDIVRGSLLSIVPVDPEDDRPYTAVRFELTEVLKGELGDDEATEVSVRVGGATLQDAEHIVVGAPEFGIDNQSDFILFLWQDQETEAYGLLGLAGGVYAVINGDAVQGLHAAEGEEDLDNFKDRISAILNV